MKTPPITAAQIQSYLLLGAAVALQHYGWMTTDVFFGVAAFAGVHIGSDAALRAARTTIAKADVVHATTQLQSMPVEGDDSKVIATAPVPIPPATA